MGRDWRERTLGALCCGLRRADCRGARYPSLAATAAPPSINSLLPFTDSQGNNTIVIQKCSTCVKQQEKYIITVKHK